MTEAEFEKHLGKALDQALEDAAERGAKKVLAQSGLKQLEDKEINEVRALLEAWQSAKTTVLTTTVKYFTMAIMGAIVFGLWARWSYGGPSGG
jgi:phosphatidylserine/phosphatidylglycerophosphate/cardiolipin synthase-like enzyme